MRAQRLSVPSGLFGRLLRGEAAVHGRPGRRGGGHPQSRWGGRRAADPPDDGARRRARASGRLLLPGHAPPGRPGSGGDGDRSRADRAGPGAHRCLLLRLRHRCAPDGRLEPSSSAVLSGRQPGAHQIEGLGYGFVPALIDRDLLDEVLVVEESEACAMARALARVEGVFAGTSSGFNVAGAAALASRLGPGRIVATACCDTGFKYTSGALYEAPSE
ncbi:MAG: pyridoxal-phosphate dependent enzyme [Chloroflexi bacterium]|nr:MAG: pyridoxal-phosphate dependent enzyme [Chloroflexota bacterium]